MNIKAIQRNSTRRFMALISPTSSAPVVIEKPVGNNKVTKPHGGESLVIDITVWFLLNSTTALNNFGP